MAVQLKSFYCATLSKSEAHCPFFRVFQCTSGCGVIFTSPVSAGEEDTLLNLDEMKLKCSILCCKLWSRDGLYFLQTTSA